MSTIKSSAENLTLNADGSGNDILFQSNGSQVGSLTAEGVAALQSTYDGDAYKRTRADAYEEVKEQLDQLYHDMTAGKLDATGEWHKAIKAVKDATPKP